MELNGFESMYMYIYIYMYLSCNIFGCFADTCGRVAVANVQSPSPRGSLDEPLGKAIKLKARQRSDVHILSLGDGNFDAMFFEEGLEWTNGPTITKVLPKSEGNHMVPLLDKTLNLMLKRSKKFTLAVFGSSAIYFNFTLRCRVHTE